MENKEEIMAEVAGLMKKAQSIYDIKIKALKDDREKLKTIYDQFSTSCDGLIRGMLEDTEHIQKHFKQAAKDEDPKKASQLLESFKFCFNQHNSSFKIGANQNRLLSKVQQEFHCYLKEKGDEIPKLQSFVLNSNLGRIRSNIVHPPYSRDGSPIRTTIKPKFGPFELKPKHANILITKAVQPRFVYVQIDDDHSRHLFAKLQKDLQEEFSSVTVQSDSFCLSPVIGVVYAVKCKDSTQWYRALIDMYGEMVFFVDVGHRRLFDPDTMMFHELPGRFLDLPAQSIRCELMGVFPAYNSPCMKNGTPKFPNEMKKWMMSRYDHKSAVAFFISWETEGQVGNFTTPGAIHEFKARVVVYLNGDSESINLQIGRSEFARLRHMQIELPEHKVIRQRLMAAQKRSTVGQFDLLPSPKDSGSPSSDVILVDSPSSNSTSPQINEEEMTFSVVFVGCPSTDEIFFRTQEMMEEFYVIQEAMYAYFNSPESSNDLDHPINFDVGFFCSVYSEDNWYRAVVIDVEKYPKIAVSLLDRGCSLNVDVSGIRRLPKELENVPRAVLRCSFSGISIRPKAVKYVSSQLHGAKQITIGCQKNPKGTAGKALPVTIYISPVQQGSDGPINFNRKLASLGLATTASNIHSLVGKISCWKSLELPKVGDTFTGRVSCISEKGEIFLHDIRSKQELNRIAQELYEKYHDSHGLETDFRCYPGDLCIALQRENSKWYRCVIKEVNGDKVTVYFADYGIVGAVDINDVRLDIALEEKAVQVLRCSLYNVKSLSDVEEWRDQLMREAVGLDFQVTVKVGGHPLLVEMVPTNSAF